ncbi:MAG: hypothetical protein RLZZ550_185 [Verrucomicrobiota bacterium]|jgi:hypothetical protein
MQLDRLIARIRGQLELGSPDLEARSLAGEYAALCARARERLEQCAGLIRGGQEHAAFQVAESEPDLLGLCAQLSFAESERWHALCRERGLPTGFPLDDQQVVAVEGLYGKEIGENHPLYRDYREAMRTRQEDRALTILRSIVRINPNDPNARSELDRLSTKFLREALGKVAALFEAAQPEEAVTLMKRMELFGASALAGEARWEAALRARRDWLRAKALEQIAHAGDEAAKARAGGHWEVCAAAVGRARSLERDHQVNLPAALATSLAELEGWAGELAATAEAEAALRAAVESLGNEWRELQQEAARGSSPATLVARLGNWLERAMPVADRLPEGLVRDARTLRQLTRARLGRRYALLTATLVVAVLGAGAGAFLWLRGEAADKEARERFATAGVAVDRGDAETAARLLDELRARSPRLAEEPAQKAAEEALRQRIADQRAALQRLQGEAGYLKARQAEGLALSGLADVRRRAAAYLEEVGKLGPAAQATLAQTLPDASKLLAEASRLDEQAAADLAAARRRLRQALGDTENIADVAKSVAALDQLRALLDQLRQAGLKNLDEAYAEADRAGSRLEDERKSLGAVKSLETTADLRSYLAALKEAADAAPEKAELRQRGETVLAKAEALRNLPRSALAPRFGAMWDGCATSDAQGLFQPKDLGEGELKLLKQLTDETVLRSLRKFSVVAHSAQGPRLVRSVYVVGDLAQSRSSFGDGIEIRTEGKELTREGALVDAVWSRRDFVNGVKSGEELQEGLIIPEVEYLRGLGRFHDPKTGQLAEPLLRTLDRLRRGTAPYLEVRAYQLQELYRLGSLRPDAWGLLYSPSAQRDAEQLRRITANRMGAFDFLHKEKWSDAQTELKVFLLPRTGPGYADEARFWRTVLGTLRERPLIFAGHVGRDGKAALRDPLANVVLYGIDAEGRATVLFRVNAEGIPVRVAEAAPWTPLLRLPGTVAEAAQAAGIPAGLTPPTGGWEALLQGRDL